MKANVDAAVKLFSTEEPDDKILRGPYNDVKQELNDLVSSFKEKYPDVQSVDSLQSEYEKRDFVLAFREIIRKHTEIQVYDEFEPDDPELMDFRSKYLDITVGYIAPKPDDGLLTDTKTQYGEEKPLEDIDYCLELLHSDVINVAYILSLIGDLDPHGEDYQERRQRILDTMIKDATMRNKTRLIDGFMRKMIDQDADGFAKLKADGTIDLESKLNDYIAVEKQRAIHNLSEEEGVEEEALSEYVSEYDFLQKEKPEILQAAIRTKKLGLKERRSLLQRLTDKLNAIIRLFDWK